jgi:heme/copper-type cytochrome/quinol oxidase subunit 3
MDRPRTHGLALFLAAFPLVASAFVALFGLVWGQGLQCDESCTGEDWQHTAGAPQWTLLTIAGFVVFAAGIALFVSVYRSRPWHALGSLAIGAATFVIGLTYSGIDWYEELHRHPLTFGAIACMVISGVLAALLCAPTEGQSRPSRHSGMPWLLVAALALPILWWVLNSIWFGLTQAQ